MNEIVKMNERKNIYIKLKDGILDISGLLKVKVLNKYNDLFLFLNSINERDVNELNFTLSYYQNRIYINFKGQEVLNFYIEKIK